MLTCFSFLKHARLQYSHKKNTKGIITTKTKKGELMKTLTYLMMLGACACIVGIHSMDTGTTRSTMPLEPSFAQLEEDSKSLAATIYDEDSVIEVYDLSFYGHTSIGGVRKETDDSLSKINLEMIKELIVEKSLFISKRFADQEFTLVEITTNTNAVVKNLLVPRHIVICAIDQKSHLEKAWFLNKINRIVIQGAFDPSKKPEDLVEKIYEKKKNTKTKQTRSLKHTKKAPQEKIDPTQVPPQEKGFTGALKNLAIATKDLMVETVKTIKNWFN